MNLYELKQEVLAVTESFVDENCQRVLAEKCGLDIRCGYIYISKDLRGSGVIAIQKGMRARLLEYYGGFEYVDSDSRTEVGEWVFYDDSDERVLEALQYFSDQFQSEAA
jgi:hypothetical protein